ncbi:MAG: MmgE/PrpD family protein [Betaproteobacteria bacterium]|nr:MmgE/PrpD family protein [Betaproteobacteria bacterium]
MTLVQDLARWVITFDAGAIPERALDQAKQLVLDSLGCALGALAEESSHPALRTLRELGGNADCTVIGTDLRTSSALAVLANGVLVRALDLNDVGLGASGACHPSDNIPVALSMGERQDTSGREALATIVMGYELYGRIHDLMRLDSPWDNVTASSPVAAAMAGRLLRLPPGQLAHALALAMSHSHVLGIVRMGQLSAAKGLADAMVAHAAVMATWLAAQGASGPQTVFEGPRGMLQAALDKGGDNPALVAALTAALTAPPDPARLRIMDVSIKAYPCLASGQAAVAAALQVHSQLNDPLAHLNDPLVQMNDPLAQIGRVRARMADTPFVRSQVLDPQRDDPQSRETADHSFLYLIAVALLDGELTPRQFAEGRWFDPSVRALMARTSVATDAALNRYTPGAFPCALEVTLKDGRIINVDMPYPPGNMNNPLGWTGVEAKFHRYAEAALSAKSRAAVVATVREMESLGSVRELMRLVAAD